MSQVLFFEKYVKQLLLVSAFLGASHVLAASKPRNSALSVAALDGNYKQTMLLLEQGANPNCFMYPKVSLIDMVIRKRRGCDLATEFGKDQYDTYAQIIQALYTYGGEIAQNKFPLHKSPKYLQDCPKYLQDGTNGAQAIFKPRLALYEEER